MTGGGIAVSHIWRKKRKFFASDVDTTTITLQTVVQDDLDWPTCPGPGF